MNKKYQVFVSSTYEDLKEERKSVSQALLESNCIPAGMELFPASNKTSWEIIKKVINESDYYLLIIAGKYGSTGIDDNGNKVGYTEMEYNYAKSIKKPIIVFINKNIENIPVSKSEKSQAGKRRLERFKKKILNSHIQVSFWYDIGTLISEIKTSIQSLIQDSPSNGWVKGADININKFETFGVKEIYTNVNNINYNKLINSSKNNIDIVHIHGMTWTNSNRATLKNKLKEPNVTIRVVLLDIDELFFAPYSNFIKKDKKYLIAKTYEVLDIWETMYSEVTNNRTKVGAKLEIYFHRGFPSKSLYRFDNTILSIPNVMIQNKSNAIPTIQCVKTSNDDCVFNLYSREIDWLISNHTKAFNLTEKSLNQYVK